MSDASLVPQEPAVEGKTVQLTPDEEKALRDADILAALDRGEPYREIVKRFGLSFASVSRLAHRHAELETETMPKLMALKKLHAVDAWFRSMDVAADQGKHAPAKEWLTHAGVLAPVQSDSGSGAKVAVIIGVPGSPLDQPTTQVIVSQQDTDK